MLFGTFQPFPISSQTNSYCNPLDAPRKFYPDLGFAPVWAFPIPSLEDAFAHSLCIFPNFPEILYIVEPKIHFKLDKVRWHKDRKDGTVTKISDYLDSDIPYEYSEILLHPDDIFGEEGRIKVIVNVIAIKDFIEDKCELKTILLESADFPEEVVPHIKKRLKEVWEKIPEPKIEKEDLNFVDWERKKVAYKCKQVFTAVLLPFIYQFAMGEPAYPVMTEMCSVNLMRMLKLQDEINEWVKTDCSDRMYLEVYGKMLELPVMNLDVLGELLERGKIGPNEKCPCGSGKKFKKCHGRQILG